MYNLELDLIIYFVPPMNDYGNGIRLTRMIQIPFVPHEGLSIYGSELDYSGALEGLHIKDVVWDMDRQVFRANTELVCEDPQWEMFPEHIRMWTDIGWRMKPPPPFYEDQDEELDYESAKSSSSDAEVEWDLMERYPSMPPRKRPKEFNLVMRAMIRTMAECNNNCSVAYAMDKTKLFFTEDQFRDEHPKAARKAFSKWRDAEYEFDRLSSDEQEKWFRKVERKYPRLDNIVAKS